MGTGVWGLRVNRSLGQKQKKEIMENMANRVGPFHEQGGAFYQFYRMQPNFRGKNNPRKSGKIT
jgi:hypothetical protein